MPRELEDWLASGLVDVILTYDSVTRGNQTVHPLPAEDLVLYSDRPDTPIKADPNYIFVDHGEEYRRQHGETYHDAGTARISFDSSRWALEYLLERGGSAYLPRALAHPHVVASRLHQLTQAPTYSRKKNLISNDTAAQNWTWFEPLIATIRGAISE